MLLETLELRRPEPALAAQRGPELTVIAPTFNERDNVEPLIAKLAATLQGVHWEVIFVDDDSPDGTADKVRERGRLDSRVRCVQRLVRRGLSSACAETVLASSSPYIAIIDDDWQQGEMLLPTVIYVLRIDIAVVS